MLGRDLVARSTSSIARQDLGGRLGRVGRRVDADHRVAAAVRRGPRASTRGCPATSSVGWFGWQRDDSRPGRPSVLFARTTTWHFAPTVIRSKFDISLHAAADHLGREAGRDRAQRRAGGRDVEQPLAELADREVRDRAVRLVVELVLDQPRELVLLVRARPGSRAARRSVSSASTARAATRSTASRADDAGEVVAALRRVRLREHVLDRRESVAHAADRGGQLHAARVTRPATRRLHAAGLAFAARSRARRRRDGKPVPLRNPRVQGRPRGHCRHLPGERSVVAFRERHRVRGLDVRHPEPLREAAIGGSAADARARGQGQAVGVRQHQAEPGQRLAAPAHRRPGGCTQVAIGSSPGAIRAAPGSARRPPRCRRRAGCHDVATSRQPSARHAASAAAAPGRTATSSARSGRPTRTRSSSSITSDALAAHRHGPRERRPARRRRSPRRAPAARDRGATGTARDGPNAPGSCLTSARSSSGVEQPAVAHQQPRRRR